jgi:ribosomal protein S17
MEMEFKPKRKKCVGRLRKYLIHQVRMDIERGDKTRTEIMVLKLWER